MRADMFWCKVQHAIKGPWILEGRNDQKMKRGTG